MRMRLLAVLSVAMLVLLAGSPVLPAAAMPPDPVPAESLTSLESLLADMARAMPVEAKVDQSANDLVSSRAPGDEVLIIVQSAAAVDLGPYGRVQDHFTWPAGEHVTIARVRAGAVTKVAQLPGVYAVSSGELDPAALAAPSYGPPGPDAPKPAELQATLRAAPPWSEAVEPEAAPGAIGGAIGGDLEIQGWYDVLRGHSAKEAWDLGYRGEGVKVAILDYPVDFTHPDLQGTWATLPAGHAYAGWPQMFDPAAVYTQYLARRAGQPYNQRGYSGYVEAYQTSAVTTREIDGRQVSTGCFKPLVPGATAGSVQLLEPCRDYLVPGTSKGAQVRFGHHPDPLLRPFGARPSEGIAAEYPGVLVVDAAAAGVYDTVYVDLDGDRDFTDEKPATKADPTSWRDTNGDGFADVSGGTVYWIADGNNPFPGSWSWGITQLVPDPGAAVGFMFASGDPAIANHGTLCASAIGAQGKLGVPPDRAFRFRDLPGTGSPAGTNLGIAPRAGLVSVGNALSAVSGQSMRAIAWRWAFFGDDEIPESGDDVQVVSHSYGWSNVDNDGWDVNSRLMDHYVRRYGPNVTQVFATGNGGPGYGTMTAPKPATGLGIAASTQMGSTGAVDSITDTTQITFGDIVPFSNRGPASIGRTSVNVATNGGDGMGATVVNFTLAKGGQHANEPWGGTSRSTPVSAGAVALIYDAFKAKNARWPTWDEARAILMAGARYNGYDVFTSGAGVVDAGNSARIADGTYGIYANPPEWTAGGYRGTSYPSFANLVAPGETATATLGLTNPSAQPVAVKLSAQELLRIDSYTGTVTVDVNEESAFYRAPDYLVPIDKAKVPAGTDLLVVRGAFPMDKFNPDGDYDADQLFSFGVVQHTDINNNGKLWTDADGNGAVDHQVMTDSYVRVTSGATTDVINSVVASPAIAAPIPAGGMSGALAWFGRGCTVDTPVQDVSGKLALIERGTCTFTEKLQNAANAGAIGAIVFNDHRKLTAMGGSGYLAPFSAVLIPRRQGQALRDRLLANEVVNASVNARTVKTQGLGTTGAQPLLAAGSEIEPYEFMRLSYDYSTRNQWEIAVHHPLERWADGLYIAVWHTQQPTLTDLFTTDIQWRVDAYGYRMWPALSVSKDTVTVPAGGEATFEATFTADADAASGAVQGAIFADYPRGLGDTAIAPPGGYERADMRTVIPVNANIAAGYEFNRTVTLGGPDARDADARYDNGAMHGMFNWQWRAESGDWRFFFVDALTAPLGTHWLFRTTWDDPMPGNADIDTRVYGPSIDAYSLEDHPNNDQDNYYDGAWYGPYPLALLMQSPYVMQATDPNNNNAAISYWPFDTSTGENEDWLVAPASEGLHEVMLDNVLFSGAQIDMPYKAEVSAIKFTPYPGELTDACGTMTVTSYLDLEGVTIRTYGMSRPMILEDVAAVQDNADDPSTSTFKRDFTPTSDVGFFAVTLDGEDDDDLDVFVLYDTNQDGQFDINTELVAMSTTPEGDEYAELPGIAPAGHYQVWVHGYAVAGEGSTFDVTIDVVTGDSLSVEAPPTRLAAGVPSQVRVCVDPTAIEGEEPPMTGVVAIGWQGTTTLLRAPISWIGDAGRTIFLPATMRHALIGPEPPVETPVAPTIEVPATTEVPPATAVPPIPTGPPPT